MQFWAAFLKTRPKKTQPDGPAFCSAVKTMPNLKLFFFITLLYWLSVL